MTLTLQEQKQIIELINCYNSTDKQRIQRRLIKYIDESGYKNKALADFIGVSEQTIYNWRKTTLDKVITPSFEMALKLCDVLNLPITELIKG